MASYLEDVESLFLSSVRKCLSLRVNDLEIVRDWDRRGVPLDVVSRGIVNGIRRFLAEAEPDAPVPSALKYYRSSVEKEFETWQRAAARGLAVHQAPTPISPATSLKDRARTVLAAREAAATGAMLNACRRASSLFQSAQDSLPLADLLFQIEDILVTELGQSLDPDSFASIKARVDAQVATAAARGVGRRAVEDLRRNLLRREVAAETGFESFLDEVLEKHKTARKG